jgi:hypothetical protein
MLRSHWFATTALAMALMPLVLVSAHAQGSTGSTVYAYANPILALVLGDEIFNALPSGYAPNLPIGDDANTTFGTLPGSYYSLTFDDMFAETKQYTASAILELQNSIGSDASELSTDLLSGNFESVYIMGPMGSPALAFGFWNLSLSAYDGTPYFYIPYGGNTSLAVSGIKGGSGIDFVVNFYTESDGWFFPGTYTEIIEFNGVSSDDNRSLNLAPIYLTLTGTEVPEAPGIFTVLAGLLGLGMLTRSWNLLRGFTSFAFRIIAPFNLLFQT